MPSQATQEFRDRVLNQKTVWSAGAYDALSARSSRRPGSMP